VAGVSLSKSLRLTHTGGSNGEAEEKRGALGVRTNGKKKTSSERRECLKRT